LGEHDFIVDGDSKLFALGGNPNIPGDLKIHENTNLEIIDNPNDSTHYYSITLGVNNYGSGTIKQRSHSDLIFTGRGDSEGTINTFQPKIPRTYDRYLYKARHLIKNFFCKLK